MVQVVGIQKLESHLEIRKESIQKGCKVLIEVQEGEAKRRGDLEADLFKTIDLSMTMKK